MHWPSDFEKFAAHWAEMLLAPPISSKWLNHWQTLIAGLLALGGAWMTVSQMRRDSRAEAMRKRRAARAMLVTALDRIDDYARESVQWLKGAQQQVPLWLGGHVTMPNSQFAFTTRCPLLDDGAVATLVNCIEHFDDRVGGFVNELHSHIRAQHSRMSGLTNDINHLSPGQSGDAVQRNISEFLGVSVFVGVLVQQLYPYARADTEKAPVPPGDKQAWGVFHRYDLNDATDAGAINRVRDLLGRMATNATVWSIQPRKDSARNSVPRRAR